MNDAARPIPAPAAAGAAPWSQTIGTGPDLVLLHGWGLHSGIWAPLLPALSRRFRVTCIDLPGFGASAPLAGGYDARALAGAVLAAAPPRAAWLGWSLGGMVALQAAALAPERVTRLLLVAASPRFVQGVDWPHAVSAELLERFCDELARDYRATLGRFLALQAQGSERAREELRGLREILFARGEPALAGLQGGLEILRTADLRPELAALRQPLLWVGGRRDTLVPRRVTEGLLELNEGVETWVVPGAAHAPFLSHPEPLLDRVRTFVNG
ncbi:pimeloyl-ACP methyl ester esterase BioH [Thioalbus denitrificans]|uniref:Pimeloyl-[acyl-carrier protein] methyl ester esterase n=1 Tax=Thioalbus denitrificans TaxID=547122 RepID=A0A369CI45_9GAMM|nr:pimeloyl-ACP methyl ester esterase BioH [Thioalbus denitrificans]RCX33221.1 carboxylesterase BioH (pimeloyl-CoA synthesis) [Thioalbus denitrificans]